MSSYSPDINSPLTPKEEQRLSTLANFFTLALFRPLDTFKSTFNVSRTNGNGFQPGMLWRGWPKQIFNKALDDEIFMSNVGRVTSFVEETLNVNDPASTPQGKALVGVLARILTLGVLVPYQALQDPSKRTMRLGRSPKLGIPIVPLYAGLQQSILKESVFTASYILSGAYYGTVFGRHRARIHQAIQKQHHWIHRFPIMNTCCCKCPNDQEKEKCDSVCTDVALASLKAAAAGATASVITSPIDLMGRGCSVGKQIEITSRKAFRKACYNGVNTIILQSLQRSRIHRRIAYAALDLSAAKEKGNCV